MDFNDYLNEIKNGIHEDRYTNEAGVSQGIILPTLQHLGWPIFNTNIVFPQFNIENKFVDYALCNDDKRVVMLIEVKKIGSAEGAERQIFQYAFVEGIQFVILTDGRVWNFYLPGEEGKFPDRRVYKLDLMERDTTEVENYFRRYLEYEDVISGKALEVARDDYKGVSKNRKIDDALPKAWEKLFEDEGELISVLANKVEEICGYAPSKEKCKNFLSKKMVAADDLINVDDDPLPTKRAIVDKLQNKFIDIHKLKNMKIEGRKPKSVSIQGEIIETRSWADFSTFTVEWLIKQGHINRKMLPIHNHANRDRYLINTKPVHENPSRTANWRKVRGVYVDCRYNTPHHIENIISLLDKINLKGLDIRVKLKE